MTTSGWNRVGGMAVFKDGGSTNVFDEKALRDSLASYLSDSSRARFGGDNFMPDSEFIKGIEWHVDGLRLLIQPSSELEHIILGCQT